MAIPGNDGVISAGLSSDLMRLSIENKNLLDTKGSLYVGTSDSVTIRDNTIPVTKKLSVSEQQYTVLTVENGDLVWKKITSAMITDVSAERDFSSTGLTIKYAGNVSEASKATVITYTPENTEDTIESRLQRLEG